MVLLTKTMDASYMDAGSSQDRCLVYRFGPFLSLNVNVNSIDLVLHYFSRSDEGSLFVISKVERSRPTRSAYAIARFEPNKIPAKSVWPPYSFLPCVSRSNGSLSRAGRQRWMDGFFRSSLCSSTTSYCSSWE
jgi:hypothetical protein